MNIFQSIQDLLYEHECVILPQFGGFVTNYKPAFTHPKKQIILPPSKQISFNVNLKNNDGLLANHISQKEQISYQTALDFVNSTITEFSDKLTSDKRLLLDGIGTISVNPSGSLEFSPEDTTNFLRNSFGLSPVILPTLAELILPIKTHSDTIEAEEEVKEVPIIPITVSEEIEEPVQVTKKKSGMKWVAAAAFFGLMYFGGVTVHQNSADISSFFSSLWPGQSHNTISKFNPRIEGEQIRFTYDEPVAQLQVIADQNPELRSVLYSFEHAEIRPDGLKVILSSDATSSANDSDTNYTASTSSGLELYFVVAGCFKEKENADGLVKKLRRKGFDAGIFGKKRNLHLVCYGSYTNKSAAKEALSEIKSNENPGAWLKKH